MKLLNQKVLFNKNECDFIISQNHNHITNWRMYDRKYNSQSINYSLETNWIFMKLKKFVEEDNDIQIKSIKETIHFHKFEKGDWFGKHNDEKDSRVYAVGVLLNDNFQGGDFKLYNPNELILKKETGNTYLFDVKINHEILPILYGERFSLLWFLEKDNIKFYTNKLL